MNQSRRNLIKGIGAAICAGLAPAFIPRLLPEQEAITFSSMIDGVNFGVGDIVVIRDGIEMVEGKDYKEQLYTVKKTGSHTIELLAPIEPGDRLSVRVGGKSA